MGFNEEPAISVQGLVKSFGSVRALDGVDLEAAPGTVLGVLGPNGAGKTTTVRVLTTLLAPDAGSARVAGLDVVADAARLRSNIGLAGQYAAVDENLTGTENLTMVGRLYGNRRAVAKRRAHDLLERFALTDAADRPAKSYSGGMRRRLDLAAALVAAPPVLFLDEPTTGLDPRSRIDLWETIEDLVADGTTVLLTTQYLEEADRLADRVAVVDHGRVIAEGTADELKGRVGGQRLEVTLTHEAAAFAAMTALEGMSEEPPHADGVLVALQVPERDGAIMEAARRLSRAGVSASDVVVRTPTLDDVFLSLTGHAARKRLPPSSPSWWPHDPRTCCDASGGGSLPRLDEPEGLLMGDTLVMAERNLVRLPRNPDMLLAFTVQPIMFVLLFAYVFGGAIAAPGFDDYIDFLIPGMIVQQIAFGGFATALGLAEDMTKGLIDRFRSLPTQRHSVLAGRTLADIATNLLSVVILVATGFVIGFRFDAGVSEIVAGLGLLLLFGFAFSWIFALIGMSVSSPEAANGVGFTLIFPITFISSAFVPVESMPAGLEQVADANPVSVVVDAMRALWLGAPAGNSLWLSVVWCVVLIVVFAPLAVAKYRKAASR